jgi:biopolymer transport protein ExbB
VTNPQRTAALDAVKRALARSAVLVHTEMSRGINTLAAIATTAPLVGAFGTLLGIANSFPGSGTDKWTMLAAVAERLSGSLVPAEIGLLVALLAFCGHKYFRTKIEEFDVEMENASLQLIHRLASITTI